MCNDHDCKLLLDRKTLVTQNDVIDFGNNELAKVKNIPLAIEYQDSVVASLNDPEKRKDYWYPRIEVGILS